MKTVLVVMLIFMLSACDVVPVSDPEKPATVPESAFWVGGDDGGVFVTVSKKGESYQGTIYWQDGEIWYEGPLEFSGEKGKEPDIDDPEIYMGWDGDDLLLQGGEALSIP
ncbi:hypothetical protein [Marinobacter sp. LN3S78]|uniref:hypothetical protein n=1 Tax=Marinobacter sp. LN3S78 TaxID=3382300 RepID=UPI00387B2B56